MGRGESAGRGRWERGKKKERCVSGKEGRRED